MRLLVFIALTLLLKPAFAEPPPGADMSLAPWFRSLTRPGNAGSCCDMGDCRVTEWRPGADGYEAKVDGKWMSVPPESVLNRHDNPTGGAVVCYTPYLGIMCFVMGPET